MIKVAINGFGRIGRQVLRAGISDKKISFVAINDLTNIENLEQLLKRDSVYGKFNGKIKRNKKELVVNNKTIKVFSEKNPEKLPWKKLGIDVVIESTGIFLTRNLANKHLQAGAKKVLISAPAKDSVDSTIVKGVNDTDLKKTDKIISNGSCTTNSLAPILKILNENLKIKEGFMTTIHAYTNDQKLVDSPHSDLRRGRAAGINSIPTTTGATKTIEKIIPELKGKIDGTAIRIPLASGSITEIVCKVEKKTDQKEVNSLFEKASKGKLKGILEYSEEPLVSSDILGNSHSSIFDSKLTKVVNGSLVKVFSWYDNEIGFSQRIIDVIKLMK